MNPPKFPITTVTSGTARVIIIKSAPHGTVARPGSCNAWSLTVCLDYRTKIAERTASPDPCRINAKFDRLAVTRSFFPYARGKIRVREHAAAAVAAATCSRIASEIATGKGKSSKREFIFDSYYRPESDEFSGPVSMPGDIALAFDA